MEIWQCSAQFTFLPDWPLLDPFARTDFPFCLFRLSPESLPRSLSQLNGCNNSESNEPRGRSILGNETHSRFLAEIRSRGVGRFLACTITSHPDYEMTLVKEREKRNARERSRGKGFSFFFSSSFSRTRTHARTFDRTHERPIARELRKAMQARATRRALVPSYVLPRTRRSRLVLPACPLPPRCFPCPSTSWSLFRSPSLSTEVYTLVHHPSFSFSPPLSFPLDLWCLDSLSLSFLLSVTTSTRCDYPRSMFFPMISSSPSFWNVDRLFWVILVFRSMLAPVQFNPFISLFKWHTKEEYMRQCFPWKLVCQVEIIFLELLL